MSPRGTLAANDAPKFEALCRYDSTMRGIIIAGGFGTRLRPLTLTRPKPLMSLVGAPLLRYQLEYLHKAGITEVCFATNYMAEAVESEFGDGASLGMKLRYAVEQEPLDTAGAIRNAYETMPGDDCVIFNGDVIHDFDIASIIAKHTSRDADITLTLRSVQRPHAFGVVHLNTNGMVEGFLEPSEEQKRTASGEKTGEYDSINAGLYVMSKAAIETIPLQRCNIEREIFPKLIQEGWKVYGEVRDEYWIDIGRPAQYLDAVDAVVSGKVGSPHKFLKRGDAAVDPTAEVADGATLCCNTSIGAGCTVADGAEICASALLEGVQVGQSTKIVHSIIGENAHIGANCSIHEAVIAPGSFLGDYSQSGVLS